MNKLKELGTDDLNELFELAWEGGSIHEIKWRLHRLLTIDQKIKWMLSTAKSVLGVFEDAYPEDNRPRKALEAAETYLANPTEENRLVCKEASTAAAEAAVYASATYAHAAAYVVASAAFAAFAFAFATLSTTNKKEIYKYGIKLLTGEENEVNVKDVERA